MGEGRDGAGEQFLMLGQLAECYWGLWVVVLRHVDFLTGNFVRWLCEKVSLL